MILIILNLLLTILFYYTIYSYFGFIIANTFIFIFTYTYIKYKNKIYIKLKSIGCVETQLKKLEDYDNSLKLKLMSFMFNYLQKNIIPLVNTIDHINIEEEPTSEPYCSNIFKNKGDELHFLKGLDKYTK
tara:strand:+ start:2212 stop:2601 length:390 start_codon:yes stop_codon:yes gene_type:complete